MKKIFSIIAHVCRAADTGAGEGPDPIPAESQQLDPAPIAAPILPTKKEMEAMPLADLKQLQADVTMLASAVLTDAEQIIQQKEADAIAAAQALETKAKEDIQEVKGELLVWNETFRTKHGISWQVAATALVAFVVLALKGVFPLW